MWSKSFQRACFFGMISLHFVHKAFFFRFGHSLLMIFALVPDQHGQELMEMSRDNRASSFLFRNFYYDATFQLYLASQQVYWWRLARVRCTSIHTSFISTNFWTIGVTIMIIIIIIIITIPTTEHDGDGSLQTGSSINAVLRTKEIAKSLGKWMPIKELLTCYRKSGLPKPVMGSDFSPEAPK